MGSYNDLPLYRGGTLLKAATNSLSVARDELFTIWVELMQIEPLTHIPHYADSFFNVWKSDTHNGSGRAGHQSEEAGVASVNYEFPELLAKS